MGVDERLEVLIRSVLTRVYGRDLGKGDAKIVSATYFTLVLVMLVAMVGLSVHIFVPPLSR